MKATILSIIIAIFMVACGDAVPPIEDVATSKNTQCNNENFTNFNPTNLTMEQQAKFISAAKTWGQLDIKFSLTAQNIVKIATEQDIIDGYVGADDGATDHDEFNSNCERRFSTIYILPKYSNPKGDTFYNIVLHELGHHYHWVNNIITEYDHLPKNNIMTANYSEMSLSLTEADYEFAGMAQ